MIRLILLIPLLLLSFLAIIKAPTYHLWLAAIIVTEFSVVLIALTGVLLVSGFWVEKFQLAGTVSGLMAVVLFASPIVRAAYIASDLGIKMNEAFNIPQDGNNNALSVLGMVTLKNNKAANAKPLTYKSISGKELSLDFYASRVAGKRPCVIVIHGGSWKSGDNKQLPELNSYLADAGYHVAAINYRLAPEFKNPAAVQDVEAAVTFLNVHAAQLQLDTNNLVLLGRSAGAQIALLAAYGSNLPGLKGVVDFYGPADMVWGYSVPSNPLVMDSRKVMEDYLGGAYTNVPENYRLSSPIEFVSPQSVPTLIIHGKNDVLVAYEHSIRLQRKLNQLGVKNYFLSLSWATHGFDYTLNGPGGQLSTFAVRRFLDGVTGK